MSFLPIAHRELLVSARRSTGAWVRFLSALGGVALFAMLWVSPLRRDPQTVSQIVFYSLAGLLFLYACASGLLHTADAIGAEKREGTLGLLFLTELRGYDVVIGKLCSTSTRSVTGVLALIPVLALPVMVGGISGGQVSRTIVAILVTLVFSLSVGMAASVFLREFRDALMATAAAMALLTVGLDAGGWMWTIRTGKSPDELRQWSPVAMFRWAQSEPWRDAAVNASFHRAWRHQAMGAGVLLMAASGMVGRFRNRWAEAPARRAETPEGLVGYRQHEWGVLLARHPYAWLQRVLRPVPPLFRYGFGTLWAVYLGTWAASFILPDNTVVRSGWIALWLATLLLWALHVALKLQIALATTRGIGDDRNSGGLELLMVAGVGAEAIRTGHRKAMIRQYLIPIGMVYAAQFLMLMRWSRNGLESVPASLVLIAGAAMLWPDVDTLLRVGFRHGLKDRDPQTAFRSTFLRVMLPGWIGLLPLAVAVATGGYVGLMVLLWLAITAYGWHRARRRAQIDVEYGFRELAAELPFDTDEWELRDSFRRAAGAQYPKADGGGT